MTTYNFNAIYYASDDVTDTIDTFSTATVSLVVADGVTSFTYAYDSTQDGTNPTTVTVLGTGIYGELFDGTRYAASLQEATVMKVTWGSASSPSVTYVLNVDIDGAGQYAVRLGGAALNVSSAAEMDAFNTSIISVEDVPASSAFAAGKAIAFDDLPDGYDTSPDDVVYGTSGNDSLATGDGDDWITSSGGNDTLDGGDESDTVFYENQSAAVQVDLSTGLAYKSGGSETDTLIGIENVHGTYYSDEIQLDISGYAFDRGGNDTVTGGSGSNLFSAGRGSDTYDGAGGHDVLSYLDDGYNGDAATSGISLTMTGQSAGTVTDGWGGSDSFTNVEQISGSALDDTMEGADGDDYFLGDAGNDMLSGGAGEDTLLGGAGNDLITPGNSGDFDAIVAGAGEDTIDMLGITDSGANPAIYHYDLTAGITLTVNGQTNTGTVNKGVNGTTSLLGVTEAMDADGLDLNGTYYDDVFNITVSDGGWVGVEGNFGNDTINIGAHNGTVRLDYHDGSASFGVVANLNSGVVSNDGYGSVDQLNINEDARLTEFRASDNDDSILGSAADERFISEQGNDTIDGGEGWDVIRYDRGGVGSMTVDLAAGTASGTWDGYSFTDQLANIEEVRGSRAGDDNLAGNDTANELYAYDGDDTLSGLGGDDHLEDTSGDNSLSGGDGEDYIVIAEGDNTVDGGADYDSLELLDESSEAVVINLQTGAVIGRSAHSATADVYYTTSVSNVERFVVDFEGNLQVQGSAADNDVTLLNDELEYLTFHGGEGTDQLQLHRLTRDGDDSTGMSLAEFLGSTRLSYDASTATAVLTNLSTGTEVATLTNVEEIRFADQTLTLAEVAAEASSGAPTTADDDLTGTEEDDTIDGLAGNDTIDGLAGDDKLIGGEGDDSLSGGDGNDTLHGGAGDDTLDASGGSASTNDAGDFIMPGTGSNTIIGHEELFATDGIDIGYFDVTGSGGVTITVGEDGTGTTVSAVAGVVNDTFTYAHFFAGTLDADTFIGSDNSRWEGWTGSGGDDTLDGAGGYDELLYDSDHYDGGAGSVTVNFATGLATDPFGDTDTFTNMEAVRGTALADTFTGSAALGFISYRGLDGNDTITGSTAWDRLDYSKDASNGGSAGINADLSAGTVTDGFGATDTVSNIDGVRATDLNDRVVGSSLAELFEGRKGDDVLNGQGGNDTLNGGDGADTLVGGDGDDFIFGGDTEADLRDVVYGGNGNDYVEGGYGNDELRGDAGNDTLAGGYGADTMIGGAGDDEVTGSAWGDVLFGGDGDDFINGGFGYDRVNGGAGADQFFHIGNAGHGSDWIQDYDASQGDVLFYGAAATKDDFLIQRATTASAGADDVQEVFITHISSGVLLWALVDGDAQTELNVKAGGVTFDLLS